MPSFDPFTFITNSCPMVVVLSNDGSDGSMGVLALLSDIGLKNHSVTSTFDCGGRQVNLAVLMVLS